MRRAGRRLRFRSVTALCIALAHAAWAAPTQQRHGGRVAIAGDRMAVTQPPSHAVLLYDLAASEPRLLASLIGEGTRPGQFQLPGGVALDAAGRRLYVADAQANRIQVFDVDGATVRFARAVGRHGAGPGELDTPGGMVVAPDGRLYVADAGNHRVQVFDAGLAPAGIIGVGVLVAPIDVAFDGSRLLVLDAERLRVEAFDVAGRATGGWGSTVTDAAAGAEVVGFRGPFAVGVAADGSVLVSDLARHLVQRFAVDGRRVGVWGGTRVLFVPMGLAIDRRGRVIVLDRRSSRLQVFDIDGTLAASVVVDPAALPAPAEP